MHRVKNKRQELLENPPLAFLSMENPGDSIFCHLTLLCNLHQHTLGHIVLFQQGLLKFHTSQWMRRTLMMNCIYQNCCIHRVWRTVFQALQNRS